MAVNFMGIFTFSLEVVDFWFFPALCYIFLCASSVVLFFAY
jgi:hypothetical protein